MKNLKEFREARTEMTVKQFDEKFGGGLWEGCENEFTDIKTVHVYGAADGYGFHIAEFIDKTYYTLYERTDVQDKDREKVEAALWDQWARYEVNEDTKDGLIQIIEYAAIDKDWDASQDDAATLVKNGIIPSNLLEDHASEVMTFINKEKPNIIYLVPMKTIGVPNPVTSSYARFKSFLNGKPSAVVKVPEMGAFGLFDVIQRAADDTKMAADFTWEDFNLNHDASKTITVLEEMGEVRGMFTNEKAAALWLFVDLVRSGHIIEKGLNLTPYVHA